MFRPNATENMFPATIGDRFKYPQFSEKCTVGEGQPQQEGEDGRRGLTYAEPLDSYLRKERKDASVPEPEQRTGHPELVDVVDVGCGYLGDENKECNEHHQVGPWVVESALGKVGYDACADWHQYLALRDTMEKRTNAYPARKVHETDHGDLVSLPPRGFDGIVCGVGLGEQGLRHGAHIVDI